MDKQAQAIAHHLYQAGTAADSDKTFHYLLRAAEIAQRSSAHEDALSNLENAVSLLEGGTGLTMADVEERRAGVLRSLGRKPEAVAAYEAAIAGFLAAGEPVRAAAASLPLMWIHGWSGNFDPAVTVGHRACGLLGDQDRELRARILSVMAPALSSGGRIAEALQTIAEVDALGVSDGEAALAHSHAYLHAANSNALSTPTNGDVVESRRPAIRGSLSRPQHSDCTCAVMPARSRTAKRNST